MVAPAATNPKVTQTGNYIFRVCFIDPFQGTVMAKFAKEDKAESIGRVKENGYRSKRKINFKNSFEKRRNHRYRVGGVGGVDLSVSRQLFAERLVSKLDRRRETAKLDRCRRLGHG